MPISVRVKVTVPKEVFNSQDVLRRIADKMQYKTGGDLYIDFYETVTTWKNKPSFARMLTQTSNYISMSVYTFDDKYALVNNGARPHKIFPSQGMTGHGGRFTGKRLRFQTGYASLSKAGSRKAFVGGKFGHFISVPEVSHPGFEARKFDELIANDYFDTFVQDMQDAMKP